MRGFCLKNMRVKNPFGEEFSPLELPDNTIVLKMKEERPLKDPKSEIEKSLLNPIGSKSLLEIAKDKKRKNERAKATILVSDNTRPVPYKGEEGIILPIINTLLSAGFKSDEILILIATGMHREMEEDEIWEMLDERIKDLKIRVLNHLPKDKKRLSYVGTTKRGTRAMIDTLYKEADLKIITGLVESHFMAGVSGGRKAVCPGIIGEESTYIFHGPELMGDPNSRDLNTKGNPVSDESLEIAHLAHVDFMVNVTLDRDFRITGVFSGDLEKAHEKARDKVVESVRIKIEEESDIVITHAGFVGINHYQCAKGAVAALGALKEGGYLLEIANITDRGNRIGSANYRVTLALLKLLGSDRFINLIKSSAWVFLPEQWQVQLWAKVYKKTDMDKSYFFAPQIESEDFALLPGVDMRSFLAKDSPIYDRDIYSKAIEGALKDIEKRTGKRLEDMRIYYIEAGPYSIPLTQ